MAAIQPVDNARMKLKARPGIKVGGQFATDHNIFSQEPEATPHRMRKAVEVVEAPEDTGAVKVGRKHIEAPATKVDKKDGYGGEMYDPAQSDRFRSTRRHMTSGNVITGEGLTPDAFSQKRQRASAAGASQSRASHLTTSLNHIAHAPEDAPAPSVRPQHENLKKQQRSYCPFAVDDGYEPPAQPIRPLHAQNIHHGDVLTGGAMQAQYAGRLPRHF